MTVAFCCGLLLSFSVLNAQNNIYFVSNSEPPSVSMGMELKGVGPGMVSVSERVGGEGHGQLPRPRAFSQSAMHNLERSERSNPQALAELAQVLHMHSCK